MPRVSERSIHFYLRNGHLGVHRPPVAAPDMRYFDAKFFSPDFCSEPTAIVAS